MCPFGSRIKYDTRSWDQAEDVAGSMFRLSSRVRLCLALSQPAQPPHAELHAATSHHTNISQKLGSHQTDALLKLYPSTSSHSPRLVIHYVHSCLTRISQTNIILKIPLHCGIKYDRDILDPVELSRTCRFLLRCLDQEPLVAGTARLPPGLFIDSAKAKQWARRNQTTGLVPDRQEREWEQRGMISEHQHRYISSSLLLGLHQRHGWRDKCKLLHLEVCCQGFVVLHQEPLAWAWRESRESIAEREARRKQTGGQGHTRGRSWMDVCIPECREVTACHRHDRAVTGYIF